MYQKAVLINCVIHARLWYVSHIYPLPKSYAKKIKRLTFHYLLGKKSEPIKRTTLTLNKSEGGLGVIDIYNKSKSILVSSFIKLYNSENGVRYLVEYYTDMRIAQLLNRTSNTEQVSYIGTEYYREIIPIVQKCTKLKGFPQITAKLIYEQIRETCRPTIESLYGLYNWDSIWKNLSSVFVVINERETLYKYLHEILPTKKRLKDITISTSSTCDYCTYEESNTHVVYQCEKYIDVVHWFRGILQKFCGLRNPQFIKLSFLDIPKVDKKCKNAMLMLMSTFIVSIWQARQSNMSSNVSLNYIKGKFLQKKRQLTYIFGDKIESVLPSEICKIKWSEL